MWQWGILVILLASCGSSLAQWEIAMVNRTFNIGQLNFSVQVSTPMDAFQYWCSRPGEWYMAIRYMVTRRESSKSWINFGNYGDSCVLCGSTYLLLNISRTTNTSLGQQVVPVWGDSCGPGRLHCAWAAELMQTKTTLNTIFFTSRVPTASQTIYPHVIDEICYPRTTPTPQSGTTTSPTPSGALTPGGSSGTPSATTPRSQAAMLKPWWKFW